MLRYTLISYPNYMTDFKDHFSKQASAYAAYRPTYPEALYEHLAGLTQTHDLAWDCATGNGQAAVALAKYYKQVMATDASESQLQHAAKLPSITYQAVPAEQGPLADNSADLVTVAQAVHWFKIDDFFTEVQRVLKPGGIIAIWGYTRTRATGVEGIDSIIRHYTKHTLANYWPPEVRLLNESYINIPFPFKELRAPKLQIEEEWTLDQLMGYLYSWSATQNYIEANGENPLDKVRDLIARRWGGETETRPVNFKLHFRIGRKEE